MAIIKKTDNENVEKLEPAGGNVNGAAILATIW